MTLLETIGLAWEGLVLNKLRSLLTTLGVIIGVGAVILMMAISAGAEAVIADQINGLGSNLILVSAARGSPGKPPTLVYDDALALAKGLKGSQGVAAEQSVADQVVKWGNVNFTIPTFGETPDFPTVRQVPVGSGRFFTQADLDRKNKVIVLGAKVAQDLFGETNPVDQEIVLGNTHLTVVGVMAPKGSVAGIDYDSQVYIPLTVLYQRFLANSPMGNRVRAIYVSAESPETMDSVISQIQALLAQRHGVTVRNPDFNVQTQQDIIQTQQATTETFRTLLAWVAAVSLLVGGIGIMNIMLVSVSERTREIGLRKAVGATNRDILLQFIIESCLIAVAGGILGVALGALGAAVLGRLVHLTAVLTLQSVVLAVAVASAIGLFFGIYPAQKAAQLDPITALRYE